MTSRRGAGRLALAGVPLLALAALVLLAMSIWVGFMDYSSYATWVSTILQRGVFYALVGILIGGALLLIGRFRPENRRGGWRVVALVLLCLALLGGPVLSAVQYGWIATAEPRFEAALSEVRLPAQYEETRNPPEAASTGPFVDQPYAWRAWKVPRQATACADLRRALEERLSAPVRQRAIANGRCSFSSVHGVGKVYGAVFGPRDGRGPVTLVEMYADVGG